MDTENPIGELTAEERAELSGEIAEWILEWGGKKEATAITREDIRGWARGVIAKRKPVLGVDLVVGARDWEMIIDSMRYARVIYFPTEQTRDEGGRRARRAAMEYSLWVQLYPQGFPLPKGDSVFVIFDDGTLSGGWGYGHELFNNRGMLCYATEADAQAVADILRKEGV